MTKQPPKQPLGTMTLREWNAEGIRRFGTDKLKWRFVCPVCGYIASAEEWKAAGGSDGQVAFSCVGRLLSNARDAFEGKGQGPCNYAGGGLFRLNPQTILGDDGESIGRFFAFAPEQPLENEQPPEQPPVVFEED